MPVLPQGPELLLSLQARSPHGSSKNTAAPSDKVTQLPLPPVLGLTLTPGRPDAAWDGKEQEEQRV